MIALEGLWYFFLHILQLRSINTFGEDEQVQCAGPFFLKTEVVLDHLRKKKVITVRELLLVVLKIL